MRYVFGMTARPYQKNLSKEQWSNLSMQEKINFLEDAAVHGEFKRLDVFIGYQDNQATFNYAGRAMLAGHKNLETVEHILKNHMQVLDFEMAMDQVLGRDDLACFRLMCKYLPHGLKKQHNIWKELGVEGENLKLMDDFVAATSKNKNNIFDPPQLVKEACTKNAYKILQHLADQDVLTALNKSMIIKHFTRNGLNLAARPDFFMGLVKSGADILALDEFETATLITKLPKTLEEPSVKAHMSSSADKLMDYALRVRNQRLAETLLQNNKSDLKNRYQHIVKAFETNLEPIADMFIAEGFPETGQAMADWLTSNVRAKTPMNYFLKIANLADIEKIDGNFLREFCQKGTPNHGWQGYKVLINRGLKISKFPQAASGLLSQALQGSIAGERELLLQMIDLPYLMNKRDIYNLVFVKNDVALLNKLRDRHDMHPDLYMDWGLFEKYRASKKAEFSDMIEFVLQDFDVRQAVLDREAKEVFDTTDFRAVSDKDLQDGLLALAMQMHEPGNVLRRLQEEAGISIHATHIIEYKRQRVSALDTLTGLRLEERLMRHSYWHDKMDELQILFDAMPEYVREKLGEDFIQERYANKSIDQLKETQKPLKRRLSPRKP